MKYTYRTHYVQSRPQSLAPETLAGLAPRAPSLAEGDLRDALAGQADASLDVVVWWPST